MQTHNTCIRWHGGDATEKLRDANKIGGSCLCLISEELEGYRVWHFERKQLEVKSCDVELEINAQILQINTP